MKRTVSGTMVALGVVFFAIVLPLGIAVIRDIGTSEGPPDRPGNEFVVRPPGFPPPRVVECSTDDGSVAFYYDGFTGLDFTSAVTTFADQAGGRIGDRTTKTAIVNDGPAHHWILKRRGSISLCVAYGPTDNPTRLDTLILRCVTAANRAPRTR